MSDNGTKKFDGGLEDYVDVAERISLFYDRHPDGSLTRDGKPAVMEVGDKVFVAYTALAHRYPGDPHPGMGTAWEPFPGPTPFTRDSELMNAETAAWGRAIVAVGIGASKGIASTQEVRNRSGEERPQRKAGNPQAVISEPQAKRAFAIARQAGKTDADVAAVLKMFGYSALAEIRKGSYDEVVARLESKEPIPVGGTDVPADDADLRADADKAHADENVPF